MDEAELGNGDCFGLYWPIGKEQESPIICELLHDEYHIKPVFSSVSKFILWLDENDWEWNEADLADDEFVSVYYQQAKNEIQSTTSLLLLEKCCNNLPEVSDYWFTLGNQLRKYNKLEESYQALINAYLSNWSFGQPNQNILTMLQKAKDLHHLSSDPIVKHCTQLSANYGSIKHNDNYPLLLECIDEYFVLGKTIPALLLFQNYALMMNGETLAFQQRYNFDLIEWQNQFSQFCKTYLGNDRLSLSSINNL